MAVKRIIDRLQRLRDLRLLERKYRDDMPPWEELIRHNRELWDRARSQGISARTRVVFATSVGGDPMKAIVDTTLAAASTLRGAEASFLVCDEAVPACERPLSFTYPEEDFVR